MVKEKAIAIKYQTLNQLPQVVASGSGEVARQIVAVAEQYGVPVREDSQLAELLSQLDIGSAISPACYKLVAELLCFLYALDQDWASEHQELGRYFTPIGR